MRDEFNPYKVLQVDPEADQEVIQAAYRRLARKYHPDLSSGPEAAARMATLNRAWEILGDPARRAEHDRARRATEVRAAEGRAAAHVNDASAARAGHGPAAGPPPGRPSGSVLNFGRYAGWSLGEIARQGDLYIIRVTRDQPWVPTRHFDRRGFIGDLIALCERPFQRRPERTDPEHLRRQRPPKAFA